MNEEEILGSEEGEELGESCESVRREVDGEVDKVEREGGRSKSGEGEGRRWSNEEDDGSDVVEV